MIKVKPLEWRKDLTYRFTAITDSWGSNTYQLGYNPDDLLNMDYIRKSRIYDRYDVFSNDEGVSWKVMSASLDFGPINVDSLEAGKELCEKWHQEHWANILKGIKEYILVEEDEE